MSPQLIADFYSMSFRNGQSEASFFPTFLDLKSMGHKWDRQSRQRTNDENRERKKTVWRKPTDSLVQLYVIYAQIWL